MGISLDVTSQSWGVDNLDWLATRKGFDTCRSVTLDLSLFTADQYVNGFIPSGTVLGKVTATGLYGPYAGATDEVQTITVGGSGLTSFTLTYDGQTTASIPAAATAAQVQAALQALSNIGDYDVVVSGADGGVWTVRFVGTLANTNVAQMTSTPTGGTGTVTVATQTAGGGAATADGLDVAAGFLLQGCRVKDEDGNSFTKSVAAMLWEGVVIVAKLPLFAGGTGMIDTAGKADLTFVRFE